MKTHKQPLLSSPLQSHNCIINGPSSLYRKNKNFCPEDSRRKVREIKKF